LPHAVKAANEVMCLPIYPALADDDVTRVVETILSCRSA
jgi:dTDP-4-amino-4,6-dideoxygalactose transaminase